VSSAFAFSRLSDEETRYAEPTTIGAAQVPQVPDRQLWGSEILLRNAAASTGSPGLHANVLPDLSVMAKVGDDICSSP
jgi:hypothetical protein